MIVCWHLIIQPIGEFILLMMIRVGLLCVFTPLG